MELSATLNTESMVKQKLKNPRALCDLFTNAFMHAEPYRSTFLIIVHIIEHFGV